MISEVLPWDADKSRIREAVDESRSRLGREAVLKAKWADVSPGERVRNWDQLVERTVQIIALDEGSIMISPGDDHSPSAESSTIPVNEDDGVITALKFSVVWWKDRPPAKYSYGDSGVMWLSVQKTYHDKQFTDASRRVGPVSLRDSDLVEHPDSVNNSTFLSEYTEALLLAEAALTSSD
ncbi:MAG: hypothetical protein ACREF5_02990 [Candidatus Saccharimonadales bacterium]